MLSDRSLQDIAFLMSDLGLLVPRPTHLVGKRFYLGFRFLLIWNLPFWVLKYLFQAILLFPPQGCHDLLYRGTLRMGQSERKVLIRSFVCFYFLLVGYPVSFPRCLLRVSCVILGQSLRVCFESVRQSSGRLVTWP